MVTSAALDDILKGNERFKKEYGRSKLKKIAGEHQPKAVIVTCSDARMCPEHIFDRGLGELFVVRNAGNIVLEPGTLGTIEYAVKHLGVNIVIVLGHYGCGAVDALFGPTPGDYVTIMLQYLQYAKTMAEMAESPDPKKATVVENVKYQVQELKSRSTVVNQALQSGLEVYGAVYNMDDGSIEVLS